MTTQRKRSKRRCGGKRQRKRSEPTFLIDQCLGRVCVAEALRAHGATKIVRLSDIVAPDTEDHIWLEQAGRDRWVVLTKDRHIRQRYNELAALYRAKARVFALSAAQLTSAEQIRAFVAALPKIRRVCAQRGPLFATVTAAGSVNVFDARTLRKWLNVGDHGET